MKTESENAENVAAILCEAVEIESADDRNRFLDEACAGNEQLRARVDELIGNHFKAGSFLNHPALDAVTHVAGESGTPLDVPVTSLDFLEPSQQPGSLGRLGQYEIRAAIGRGGMGIVLKAQDTNLNRLVAVKVLAPELATNATARMRFLREGQAAAAVSHDHVVTIHAVETNQCPGRSTGPGDLQLPYLVMEYIDGQSLQQKLDGRGPCELREILRIGRQIAAGLSAAHNQGLIHRDVKPSNILLQNGVQRVQITDFGLARAVDDVGITRTGEVTGTPQYMSPEQAQGHPVDARSDLFSLGSVMYAMCTGRSPFRADTSVATLRRVCDDTPRPIREVNADVPEWLVAVIDKLLAKDPEERFQSAAEVSRLLEQYLAHLQQPSAVPQPPRPMTARPLGRRTQRALELFRMPALVAVLLVVGLSLTDAAGLTQVASTVIRVVRGNGILEIRIDDPNVSLSIDGDDVVITGVGVHEFRLTPGEHEIQYGRNGEPIQQQLVSIERGGHRVLEVMLKPSVAQRGDHARHQRVWAYDGLTEVMSVSQDARFVVYRDDETDDVAIHDLQTGEDRLLTDNGPEGRHYTTEAVFSADGEWVAYNWSNRDYECALHVIRTDGSESRLVFHDAHGQWVQPSGWTPDGQEILCRLMGDKTTQIAFVSVSDGSLRVVKTLDKVSSYHPILALSPDGQLIAYEIPAGETDDEPSDVYVISVDGSREYAVRTAEGEEDKIVAWAPDGSGLLVRSTRNHGDFDAVWLVPFSDGEPLSHSYIVREALDVERPGHFTADGAFFYVQNKSRSDDELWVLRDLVPAYLNPGPQPDSRAIWSHSQIADLFSISPDETILAFRDEETGDLAIRNLTDETERRLSANVVPWEAYPDNARVSPDGRYVACEWRSENGAKTDLRVFPTDGGEPRVRYTPDGAEVLRARPQDWSPDGTQLLVRLQNGDERSSTTWIALVALEDGQVQVLKELAYRSYQNYGSDFRFSPDGRYIAYEFMPDDKSGQTDIALMSVDGAYDRVIVAHDADDDLLDWTPDGDLLFNSNRRTRKENANVRDTWLLEVEVGRPQAEPRLVMAGTTGVPQYGEFAADGTYYHVAARRQALQDVFLATLDPETGALEQGPTRASQYSRTRSAAWSPDGRLLAFYVNFPGQQGSLDCSHKQIVIRTTRTGEERVIDLPNVYRSGLGGDMLRWSPDGTSLLLDGFDRDRPYNLNRWGIYRLDLESAEVTTVETAADGKVHLWQHGWSEDGTRVVLRRALRDGKTVTQQYILRDLETGSTTEIHQTRLDDPGRFIIDGAVSPDGELLALHHGRYAAHSLSTIPLAGGTPELLCETGRQLFDPVMFGRCLAWTPDGNSLIFSRQTRRPTTYVSYGIPLLELWRISSAGGDPEPLEFTAVGLLNLDIHPDGRQIACTRIRRMHDLRATDDLLGGEAVNSTRSVIGEFTRAVAKLSPLGPPASDDRGHSQIRTDRLADSRDSLQRFDGDD